MCLGPGRPLSNRPGTVSTVFFGHQDAEGRTDAVAAVRLDEGGERRCMCCIEGLLSAGLRSLEGDTRRTEAPLRRAEIRVGPGAVHVEDLTRGQTGARSKLFELAGFGQGERPARA